jgi:hypothetical protein
MTSDFTLDISQTEARQIIAVEKYLSEDIEWTEEPQNSAFMTFSAPLSGSDGITIPGLTAELKFRVPVAVDDCKYTFTLFTFRPGGRKRAYQLEVVPPKQKSHQDQHGVLYGPHHHVGDLAEELKYPHLDCGHHEAWFRIFLDKANIRFGMRYLGPFDGGLFK